jgi:beta-glucosidase
MVKQFITDAVPGIDELLATLSLEEKISLLCGQGSFKTTGLSKYGIPSFTVRC